MSAGRAEGSTVSLQVLPVCLQDALHMQLERAGGEDALSASSGETGTDSGRGGSEDEAHSNRGSSLDSGRRPKYPRTSHNLPALAL